MFFATPPVEGVSLDRCFSVERLGSENVGGRPRKVNSESVLMLLASGMKFDHGKEAATTAISVTFELAGSTVQTARVAASKLRKCKGRRVPGEFKFRLLVVLGNLPGTIAARSSIPRSVVSVESRQGHALPDTLQNSLK